MAHHGIHRRTAVGILGLALEEGQLRLGFFQVPFHSSQLALKGCLIVHNDQSSLSAVYLLASLIGQQGFAIAERRLGILFGRDATEVLVVIGAAAADKMMPAFIEAGNQLFTVVPLVEHQGDSLFIGHGLIDLLKNVIDQSFHDLCIMLIGRVQSAKKGHPMITVHRHGQPDMPQAVAPRFRLGHFG